MDMAAFVIELTMLMHSVPRAGYSPVEPSCQYRACTGTYWHVYGEASAGYRVDPSIFAVWERAAFSYIVGFA